MYDNLIVAGGTFTHGSIIETVTVSGGAGMAKGSLLGKITATGKYVLSLPTASDGSESPSAILYDDLLEASDGDIKAVVSTSGTFNSTGVTFGAGHTVATTKDALHVVSIDIREGQL